jgi:hypothetical protein
MILQIFVWSKVIGSVFNLSTTGLASRSFRVSRGFGQIRVILYATKPSFRLLQLIRGPGAFA